MVDDEQVTKVADYIKRMYRNKNRFISDLQARIKIDLPKNPTYKNVIVTVINNEREQEFSKDFLNAESITDWIELSTRSEILNWFSKSEILKIARALREDIDPDWKPSGGVKNELIFSILKRFDNKDIGCVISQYLIDSEMDDMFFTSEEYAIGPLGVIEVEKEKDWETELLIINVMSEVLDHAGVHEFLKLISNDNQAFGLSKSDPGLSVKAFQITLAKCSVEEVFQAIDKMIDSRMIIIDEIKEIDTHRHLTPYGIIESEGDPLGNLVNLVIENTREDTLQTHLEEHEIPTGDLRQGIIELTLRETPRFFGRLFGLDKLKDIAEDMAMVALDRVTVDTMSGLWDAILRRLGFKVPSELGGSFRDYIMRIKTQVANLEVLGTREREFRLIGLMMQFFSRCERMVRELFYFHAAIIWKQHFEDEDDEFDFDIDLEIMNDLVFDQLDLDEKLEIKLSRNRLTFGEWVGLLRRLDKYIRGRSDESKKGKTNLVNYCGRTKLLGTCSLKVLDRLAALRNQYRHDKKGTIPTLSDSGQIISDTEKLYSCFIENGVKPLVLRVFQEIRNEFGLEYYIIVDETNRHRRIQKTVKLPTRSSFMISSYGGLASESFIVVKPFW